jgi:hypothetical protein
MSNLALIEELNPDHEAVALREAAPTAIQLMLDLEASGALTARALKMPAGYEYPAAESLGVFLGELKSRGNFYLGDWLIWVEQEFPEQFSQAAESTGLSEQTNLRVMAVCRNVPPTRRLDRLSWSVHAAVSGLPAGEQKAWLRKAEAQGWGYSELRKNMQASRRDEKPPLFDGDAPPAGDPDVDRVLEVARLIARSGEIAGDNVIIWHDYFVQLVAALGMED